MDINRPKEPGPYPDREFDCARALKQSFDHEVDGGGRAFLDTDRITRSLVEEAMQAGWTEADVRIAILKLAGNEQAADKDIRRFEPAR